MRHLVAEVPSRRQQDELGPDFPQSYAHTTEAEVVQTSTHCSSFGLQFDPHGATVVHLLL